MHHKKKLMILEVTTRRPDVKAVIDEQVEDGKYLSTLITEKGVTDFRSKNEEEEEGGEYLNF
jgi:hypothetical protein